MIINRGHYLNARGGSDNIRVLIDTNILILREDDRVITDILASLIRVMSENNISHLVHPLSMNELSRDRDDRRRTIMKSKLKTYSVLDSPPDPTGDLAFRETIANVNQELEVDDHLLYAIQRNAVDCLVTEDKGIHRKARRLEAQDRVLTISEASTQFQARFEKKRVITPPAIFHVPVSHLNENDTFFDSIREEYDDFDEWMVKIKRQGRECWVHWFEDGSIGALLIYKEKVGAIDCIPSLPKSRRLKLCTFKVAPPLYGQKIGELLIRLAIDHCINQAIDEMYLTHFIKDPDRLVDLIEEFGFYHVGDKKDGEPLFLKYLVVDQNKLIDKDPLKVLRSYYPTFNDGRYVKKFFVPIIPQYHEQLFTDSMKRQTKITEFMSKFIVEGNTIKKAYICHSNIKKIQPGSVILFYRSHDLKAITSIGVVEEVHRGLTDATKIWRLIYHRTVYSREEIELIVQHPTLVILFRHIFHFKKPLPLSEMRRMGLSGIPSQSIKELSETDYSKIKLASGIDERYIIH
jgi:rRNA-processing protein FCF1